MSEEITAEVRTVQSVGTQMKEMLSPATNVAASVQIAAQQAAISIACQVMAAQATPRNEDAIRVEFLYRAKDINFAESAFYSVPRGSRDEDDEQKKGDGKNNVTGPSVHLAREIQARWQHLNVEVTDHGAYLGADGKRYSDVEIQAWDIQNNSRFTTKFKVCHWQFRSKGPGYEVAGNRADEMVAAVSAKRERNAILKFIPRSFINEIKKACEATVAASLENKGTIDRMLVGFSKFNVSQMQLEAYIGKPLGTWDREDLVEISGVFSALKSGEQKAADYFTEAPPLIEPPKEEASKKPADKPAGKRGSATQALTGALSAPKSEPAQDTAASPATKSSDAPATASATSSPKSATPGAKPAPPVLDTGSDVIFNV